MNPLTQLKDIHLPEAIHNYPISIGWWVLYTILLLVIFLTFKLIKEFRRKRVAKKKAHIALTQCTSAQDMSSTIKWALLQYFPREQVANLHGESLKQFMLKTLPQKHHEKFNTLATDSFANTYKKELSEQEFARLLKANQHWLAHALPPSMKTIVQQEKTS